MEFLQSFRCGSELTYTLLLVGSLFSAVCCYRAHWNPTSRGKRWTVERLGGRDRGAQRAKAGTPTCTGQRLNTSSYFAAPTTPSTSERSWEVWSLQAGAADEKYWPRRSRSLKELRPFTENISSSINNKLVPLSTSQSPPTLQPPPWPPYITSLSAKLSLAAGPTFRTFKWLCLLTKIHGSSKLARDRWPSITREPFIFSPWLFQ